MAGNPNLRALYASFATALALALVVGGCGGDEATESTPRAADTADFPAADDRTLDELASDLGKTELVVSPASQVFTEGQNRFGFAVFTLGREPVDDAEVALYVARPDGPATGPYPATVRSLEPSASFRSQGTTGDLETGGLVYSSEFELPGKGEWRLLAAVKDGEEIGSTLVPVSVLVDRFDDVPQEGEKPPMINTPTPEDVGGDVSKIDTRVPPSSLHEDDFADVVGKEPVVLLFATAAICQSRVCGPVIDLTEEVKAARPDDASYILMEIYEDNDFEKGVRSQVKAFGLPTEPWLFVIGTDGKISTAIEGAFGKEELEQALDKVS